MAQPTTAESGPERSYTASIARFGRGAIQLDHRRAEAFVRQHRAARKRRDRDATECAGQDGRGPHAAHDEANQWLESVAEQQPIILRIGVSRGYAGKANEFNPKRCYAQLNGVIRPL